MRLKNKNILVTAAGQGIGHAAVMAMVAEGATVWATDLNPALLKSYEGVANVHTAVLDVMNKDDIQKQVALIPRIDALFNCAGVVHGGTILQATDKDWDFAFNLNARGQFWMIQAVLPKMLAQGGGSIINMASVCSSVRGLPNRFIYGDWVDQKRGGRLCGPRHSLQCHLPRHRRHPFFARPYQLRSRSSPGTQKLCGAPTHGPNCTGARNCAHRGVLGIR